MSELDDYGWSASDVHDARELLRDDGTGWDCEAVNADGAWFVLNDFGDTIWSDGWYCYDSVDDSSKVFCHCYESITELVQMGLDGIADAVRRHGGRPS